MTSVIALQLKPKHRVLDIGFGGGIALEMMARKMSIGTVVGMEMSDTALNQAYRRFQRQIKQGCLELVKGVIEEMPFSEGEFDRVATVNTIYFWSDINQSLMEIYRVLKPNGIAVIGFRPPNEIKKFGFTKHGLNLYDKETIILLLRSKGFKNISLTKSNDKNLGFSCALATKG